MFERSFFHIIRSIVYSSFGLFVVEASKRLLPKELGDWVDVHPISLLLPRLAPEFHGYRVVQISDFHIGTWLDREKLCQAVELVNSQHPDLVAITGDFVTFEPERFAPDLRAALRQLRARDGVVAVLGNHDHWTNPWLIRQILADANIHDLSNTIRTLRRGAGQLHIAGVDDYMDGLDRLDRVLSALPADGAAVLLAHEPDFADRSAATGRFDLQISGHSHGGQILLPVFGPPFLPRYGRKYPCGLYRVGEMYQYTNRGLGTAELQLRLNCRPEITVFSLLSPVLQS